MANSQQENKQQGDALDAVIQEQQEQKAQEPPKAPEAPKAPEKQEESKPPKESLKAEKPAEPDPDVMLIHPQLGTEVPVKKSLVAQAKKQGFKEPEKPSK